MAMGIRVDTIEKRIDKVCQDLFDLPLLINVATLAKKKTDKALSYFGCDWQPFLVKKVDDGLDCSLMPSCTDSKNTGS